MHIKRWSIFIVILLYSTQKSSAPALDLTKISSQKGSAAAQEPLTARSTHMVNVFQAHADEYFTYATKIGVNLNPTNKAHKNWNDIILAQANTVTFNKLMHAYGLLLDDIYPLHPASESKTKLRKHFKKQLQRCKLRWDEKNKQNLGKQ